MDLQRAARVLHRHGFIAPRDAFSTSSFS